MLEINDIVNILIKARQAYYNDTPVMSDQDYDALEESLRQWDSNHPFLARVGHESTGPWQKAAHHIPMGSLGKVNTESDFRAWALKFSGQKMTAEYKLDGLSLSLYYVDSRFSTAVTRGDGIRGEDISVNVRLMKNFKGILDVPRFTGSIRAEIMLSRIDFDLINSIFNDDEKYENPRNAAAGICRRLDGLYCKYLFLSAYDITERLDDDKKLEKLKAMGFDIPWQKVGNTEEIIEAYKTVKINRPTLEFDIDGVVIKVCSINAQESAGVISSKPKAQIAWKFDPPGAVTVFDHEKWDVGRTGIITPVAILEPIKIAGSTISKTTLCNVAELKRLGIGRGDLVRLAKMNDVIPKILEVVEHKGIEVQIPTHCPSCKSELENDGTRLKCHNDDCPGRNIYRILNWIKVAKIDQFGEALAFTLRDEGKLARIIDLYRLKQDDIAGLEGWGASSAETILNNIESSKLLRPEIFLAAVGIPGISDKTAEELLKAFGSIEALVTKSEEDITKLHGFAETSARSIVSGLKKHQSEIEELLKVINFQEKVSGGILAGMSFCFTGEMSKSRTYFQDLVTKNGGKNSSSVTKDLTYLVCNVDEGSTKSQKAKKFGTKMITEQQFIQMVGGTEEPAKPKLEIVSLFEGE